MLPYFTEPSRPSSRYDGIEIMTIGLGVVLIVAIIFVFGL